MPRRTVRRAGAILALALVLATPAAAIAAPPWQPFDAPLTTGPASEYRVAANADGAALVVFRGEGGLLRMAERAPGATTFTRSVLATSAPDMHVAAVDEDGTRIAALLDGQGIRIVQSGATTTEQRVGVPGRVIALAALADGSVLLAQGAPDRPVVRVWRRPAGGGAFAPMLSVGTGDITKNDTILLRAAPDGGAVLAVATEREHTLGDNPISSPVSRTWTARVAVLAPGAPAFDAAETVAERVSRFNTARDDDWRSRLQDVVAHAGGRVALAVRETRVLTTSEGNVKWSRALVLRRSAAGAWAEATLVDDQVSPSVPDTVGSVFLAAAGDAMLAGYVRTLGGTQVRVASSADDFSAARTTTLAGATDLRGLIGHEDGTAVAVVDRPGALGADVVDARAAVVESQPVTAGTLEEAVAAGDGAGGTVVAFRTAALRAVAVRDAGAPVLRGVSVPERVTAGEPVTLSADAADAWSTPAIAWELDGGRTASGASVTTTFATPGTATVRVTAADANGHTASTTRTVTVVAPAAAPQPGPGPGSGAPPSQPSTPRPTADVTAPKLDAVGLTRRRFTAGTGAKRGTTLRWRLDEAATLTLTIDRARRGWRSGKRCAARAPRSGRRRACTRWTAAAKLTRRATAGAGRLALTGRVGRRKLARGRYRLMLTARDAAGNTSAKRTLTFTIVR